MLCRSSRDLGAAKARPRANPVDAVMRVAVRTKKPYIEVIYHDLSQLCRIIYRTNAFVIIAIATIGYVEPTIEQYTVVL
jgi:hypothetical protein